MTPLTISLIALLIAWWRVRQLLKVTRALREQAKPKAEVVGIGATYYII